MRMCRFVVLLSLCVSCSSVYLTNSGMCRLKRSVPLGWTVVLPVHSWISVTLLVIRVTLLTWFLTTRGLSAYCSDLAVSGGLLLWCGSDR